MTLSQSALSELLDVIRAGGDMDVLREAIVLSDRLWFSATFPFHETSQPVVDSSKGAQT